MSKRIIFHLPYEPDPNRPSASQIRPLRMLDAFRNIGYDVDVVMGKGEARKNQIRDIKHLINDGETYQFLYSESSTMPTVLTESHHFPTYPFLDFNFLKYCKNRDINIGLFYRDIHWRFSLYDTQSSLVKRTIAKLLYRYDIEQYKRLVDVLFLPSSEMVEYIPELKKKKTIQLPPGACRVMDYVPTARSNQPLRILYIGGIGGEIYDLKLFILEVVKRPNITFTICCRRDDFSKLDNSCKELIENSHNVQVVHKKGEELVFLYSDCDICCLYVKPTEYWTFAMPAKLFEYVSFIKPIICVKNTQVGDFVEANRIGWAIPFSQRDLAQWFDSLDENTLNKTLSHNLYQAFEANLWESRALTVASSLTSLNNA